MVLPNELAKTLDVYVDRNSDRYCVNCCLKPEVHEEVCSDCDSNQFGLLFNEQYSGWNKAYFYSIILDQVCGEINSIGTGKNLIEELNSSDGTTFSYNEKLYFTEDAINVINSYLESDLKVA